MNYQVVEKDTKKYIRLDPSGSLVRAEADALELLSVGAEYGTNLLLIPGERLSDEFFRLSTGVAGSILQKFVQYGIKCAVVLDPDAGEGRFRELMTESNRGNAFRSFANIGEAETWLLSN